MNVRPSSSRSWPPALASSLDPAPGFGARESPQSTFWEPRLGRHLVPSIAQAGGVRKATCPGPSRHPVPLCPQASLAQQLCRQHVIAGQHMLEEFGTRQQTRTWWTLAGQEITVTFNHFMVRWGTSAWQQRSHRWETQLGQRYGGRKSLGTGPSMWSLRQSSHFSAEIYLQIQRLAQADIHHPQGQLPSNQWCLPHGHRPAVAAPSRAPCGPQGKQVPSSPSALCPWMASGPHRIQRGGRGRVGQGWGRAPSPLELKQPRACLCSANACPFLQRTIGQILASTEAFSRFETILEVGLGERP